MPNLVKDSQTGEYRAAHHIAPDGTYNGKQVIQTEATKNK
ncbi:hypothetical protein FM106_20865 [Brachybacterium faecium]|nr:hypothetical protein FM106_20865 [Brachybacterium faecium]